MSSSLITSTGFFIVFEYSFSMAASSFKYLLPAWLCFGSGFLALNWFSLLLSTFSIGSFLISSMQFSTYTKYTSFSTK